MLHHADTPPIHKRLNTFLIVSKFAQTLKVRFRIEDLLLLEVPNAKRAPEKKRRDTSTPHPAAGFISRAKRNFSILNPRHLIALEGDQIA